ncbi:MAG: AAA family ATPase [Dehalococcoidia bacterium]|nr:AAA family ATPase [Dehalococcoidia bacterium]
MKLREVTIKNFRCLVDTTVPIDDSTVLIGENNSGKTAFLDALRIALPRSIPGRGGTPFDEYDYHMCKAGDSPQTCEGIIIELWFREDMPEEWPASLVQALNDFIQTDPVTDLDSIGLRLSSKYDQAAGEIVSKWDFLALDGQPLGGRGARIGNLGTFLPYIRLFYLSAVRDADNEFAPRSQFWGRILRELKISEAQRKTLSEELERLNAELLKADPRLEQVVASLGEVQTVMELGLGQNTSIQALPIKPWDLMSKSQVVMKASGAEIDFPLSRYGDGMQSLAVIFLFQAYFKVFLKPVFHPETEAILALEEPEAHLHPQATRALAANLDRIQGQKIISSHSPYFIQEIPFKKIRMFRRDGPISKVVYIKQRFTAMVPQAEELVRFCTDNSTKFSYHSGTSTLSANGRMEDREYRQLLKIYPGQSGVHARLKQLRDESQLYLSNDDLNQLDTFAKRIRGEILFARAWLLCEGQCEYLLLRYFAELLGKPLDRAGVAVIDFQNNGSPTAFVGLARAFGIPWIMICDNDREGKKFIEQVKDCGLTGNECDELVRPLPGSEMELEKFLVNNGFANDCREILEEQGVLLTTKEGEAGFEGEIASRISRGKMGYIISLIEKLRAMGTDGTRVPQFLGTAINDIVAKAVS